MTHFTPKYTLIQLLEPVEPGTEFFWRDWPLHTTLADVFAVDWESTQLRQKLATLLAAQRPVETLAMDDTNFGPADQPVPVTLLQRTPELQSLHEGIVGLLTSAGAVFNTPQYAGEDFTPHVTVQKQARLHRGDRVKIDTLTIVDMFPGGDGYQRKLLDSFALRAV